MPSTYLTRTPSSSGNRKTFTFSAWFKRTELSSGDWIVRATGGGDAGGFYFSPSNWIIVNFEDSGGNNTNLILNRVFRDTSSWYHAVLRCDTTQATASDRVRFYINGVEETDFSSTLYPDQNDDLAMCKNVEHFLGTDASGSANRWSGIMSHIHLCDGYSYAPTEFGSTDATTGEWKINTSPSVSYGTTGFFILKDGNSLTDQSGQGNNWTLGAGTLTNTEDCPSDVFCTWNSIQTRPYDTPTYSNGNTTVTRSGANWAETTGSLGATKGKYYWEMKPTGTVSSNCFIGICSEAWQNSNRYADADPYNSTLGLVLYYQDGEKTVNGTTTASFFSSFTADDIIGIALDLDAATKTVTFYKNNSISGSAIDLPANMQTDFVLPVAMFLGSSNVMAWNANWGNGYFGTTAISSEGTNASGIGKFEYDVPTGYTALSTKGLNE